MQTLSQSKPRARKPHICEWCGRRIEVGEVYQRAALLGDDGFYDWTNCLHCGAFVTLAGIWECCDEGTTSDDIEEWEPYGEAHTVFVCRIWKAQWRKKWRSHDGSLYPIPTKEPS
jgi:hypothetical protein